MDNLLKIEEVAVLLDCSIQTINTWYRWKRYNPDDELASLLPEYIQKGTRNTRYWKSDDIPNFRKFKQSIVYGRNGKMGDITQRRIKDGKKEVRIKK
jgi:hypothetical protein